MNSNDPRRNNGGYGGRPPQNGQNRPTGQVPPRGQAPRNGQNPYGRTGQNPQNDRRTPRTGQPRNPSIGNAPRGGNPRRRLTQAELRELELKRRENARLAEREREMERRERKRSRQVFAGRFVVFLVVLAILLGLSVLLCWVLFRSTPHADPETGKMTYYYGGTQVRQTDMENCVVGGVAYLCFNDLSDYLGMSESGSAGEMKFLLRPKAEVVVTEESGETTSPEAETEKPETIDSTGTGKEEYVVFLTGQNAVNKAPAVSGTSDTSDETGDTAGTTGTEAGETVGGTGAADPSVVNVNGNFLRNDGINRIIGDEVWVSLDFVEDYMKGLSVSYDKDKGEIRIARVKDEAASTEERTVYQSVEFTLKPAVTLEKVPEPGTTSPSGTAVPPVGSGTEVPPAEETLEFLTDLSEYEKYMNPEDKDAFLTLVNTTHLLDESYTPSDLVDCKYTAKGRSTQQLRLYANKALEALMAEMKASGFYNMAVYSGFRSYSYQNVLFTQYTKNEMASNPGLTQGEAEKIVLTYSTRPGTSEHQTGLAVDMDTQGTFTTDFAYTDEYAWLQENAWKFGFILRFPEDKTSVTTIQFEPWHYRFVGRYHAKKIHDAGVCLEEYIASLAQ